MGVLAPLRPVSGLGSEPMSLTGWLAITDTVDPMTHHQRQSRAFHPCAEQSPAVVVSTVHLRPPVRRLAEADAAAVAGSASTAGPYPTVTLPTGPPP